ncbi:MAG TPA: tRNA (adenosine(37)-N6)-threonylcarbamoyltransferase complex dimerization subunit type 1 TsaB [Puia sp.]|nr:tRNA (adenosine(37)-N6)-threonylcarbamoyltransferase complex dimerization subunit type 1 TsaB [Puia sp.]
MILSIDTATESASICLSNNGNTLCLFENKDQKDHAAWLHEAIDEVIRSNGFSIKDITAVAVTEGPGSYTGLRVGLSAAKGLCYALQIPLITENTLKVMAYAATTQLKIDKASILCPMIDAKRMEVFTGLYTPDLEELILPTAVILDEHSFNDELNTCTIYFFGNGSIKWKKIATHKNARFVESSGHAGHLAQLAYQKLSKNQFTDIIYSQPAYIKDFHSYIKK